MKLFLYNLILLGLTPFLALRILHKSLYDKDYRANFLQRFGVVNYKDIQISQKKTIWFHAVSLGEVIGSRDIIEPLLINSTINLTVSTPTGLRKAKELYKDYDIQISYSPLDFYLCVNSYLNKIKPDLIIVFETEIWPSMIHIASKKKIPVILSNGRMSKKSYNSYKKINFFSKDIFKRLEVVLAQSKPHAERFKRLGVKEDSIQITGSVKFDLKPGEISLDSNLNQFLENDYILAVSTHSGEDEIILRAFLEVKEHFSNIKLIIVPRHPERSKDIYRIADKKNISACIESEDINNESSVLIMNSIGKTSILYRNAEAAFVGGSLVNRGGHNIIEPAYFKCPIIIGPYMFNFETIAEEFINNDACKVISDAKTLANEYVNLLKNKDYSKKLIEGATMILDKNRGASDRQLSVIMHFLEGDNR